MYSLTLYSTSGCELCIDAEEVINDLLAEPLLADLSITLTKQDIKASKTLLRTYRTRIPVVGFYEHQEALGEINWPFDRQGLLLWMMQTLEARAQAD